MSKIEEIVPPLDFCKRIPPDSDLDKSALIWRFFREPWQEKAEWQVTPRVALPDRNNVYPAPTLQEIMEELRNYTPYCIKVCKSFNEWNIECCIDQEYGERYISADSAKNPATAALKLWIKLKGVEHGE